MYKGRPGLCALSMTRFVLLVGMIVYFVVLVPSHVLPAPQGIGTIIALVLLGLLVLGTIVEALISFPNRRDKKKKMQWLRWLGIARVLLVAAFLIYGILVYYYVVPAPERVSLTIGVVVAALVLVSYSVEGVLRLQRRFRTQENSNAAKQ